MQRECSSDEHDGVARISWAKFETLYVFQQTTGWNSFYLSWLPCQGNVYDKMKGINPRFLLSTL